MIKLAKFPINYKPISRASPPEMRRPAKVTPTIFDLNPAGRTFEMARHRRRVQAQPAHRYKILNSLQKQNAKVNNFRGPHAHGKYDGVEAKTRKGVQNINQTSSTDRSKPWETYKKKCGKNRRKNTVKTPANLVHGFRCDSDSDTGLPPLFGHNLCVVSIY